jgi:murein L,D-transpeptidase YafK
MRAILVILLSLIFTNTDFKSEQKNYSRVRTAYSDKGTELENLLTAKSISSNKLRIYIRAFKNSSELELWGKNNGDEKYQLIKVYDICQTSGILGPKRRQGDLQIPEGFYHIDRFNPYSNFYLSLGINYPNTSDKILGVKGNLGGDIFIHGSCVTIGCIPITDEQIKELYIFCVESKNNGQRNIPVTIFPAKLTADNFNKLNEKYRSDKDKINLWEELKIAFDSFNSSKQLPTIEFLNNGRHLVK